MGCTVVLGTQWGDEGKGKIVDCLSMNIDIVARFQGGANAGHTVNVNGNETILHQLPTGILSPHVTCIIGNGVVLDPEELFTEIEMVERMGLPVAGRLKISPGTHLLLPYHKALDRAQEEVLGSEKIGTTCRGIGPAYTDKVARKGVRLSDLRDQKRFMSIVAGEVEHKSKLLAGLGSREILDREKIVSRVLSFRDRLLEMMEDVSLTIDGALRDGKRVLLEGAQGTMLDIDHGSYPYVTSSNTSIGAAVIGLGLAPSKIGRVLGVTKAYTTRVGMGPFPTELRSGSGDRMRERGREFGATTGRPRRCGWLDAVLVRYSVRINGTDSLVLTKLDVLDELEHIRVAVAYRAGGELFDQYPSDPRFLFEAEPVYEEFEGWLTETSSVRTYEELPAAARAYIEGVSKMVGCKVGYVSVGPSRAALIRINRPHEG